MNKNDLVSEIAGCTNLTKTQIRQVVEETFNLISKALINNEEFKMTGFGSFKLRKRAGREVRNPRTGEKMSIEARLYPSFKPGKKLLEQINVK